MCHHLSRLSGPVSFEAFSAKGQQILLFGDAHGSTARSCKNCKAPDCATIVDVIDDLNTDTTVLIEMPHDKLKKPMTHPSRKKGWINKVVNQLVRSHKTQMLRPLDVRLESNIVYFFWLFQGLWKLKTLQTNENWQHVLRKVMEKIPTYEHLLKVQDVYVTSLSFEQDLSRVLPGAPIEVASLKQIPMSKNKVHVVSHCVHSLDKRSRLLLLKYYRNQQRRMLRAFEKGSWEKARGWELREVREHRDGAAITDNIRRYLGIVIEDFLFVLMDVYTLAVIMSTRTQKIVVVAGNDHVRQYSDFFRHYMKLRSRIRRDAKVTRRGDYIRCVNIL